MATRRGRGEGSVYRRVDGRWVGSVDLGWRDGKRQRKVVYGTTRREIADKLIALHGQKATTGLATGSMTLETWFSSWITDAAGRLAERTVASYRMNFRLHIGPVLGRVKLADLQPARVQRWMTNLLGGGMSPRMVAYNHAILRSALSDAERAGLVPINPASRVKAPKVPRRVTMPPDQDELDRLFKVIRADRQAALWMTLVGSGCRLDELLSLDWAHVDLDGGVLRVIVGKTDRARRSIPLPAKTIAALEELPHREGRVFPSMAGTKLSPRNVHRRWHALCDKAGTRRFRIHDLRHASGSLALAAGVDIVTVSRRLGHASVSFTADVYAHVMGSLAKDAADRLNEALG